MFSQINFIKERRKLLVKERSQDRKLFLVSAVVFLVMLLVSVGLLGANFWLTSKINASKQMQVQLNKVIEDNQSVELEYSILIDKLKVITKLFGIRQKKQEALAYFSSLFGEDVIVSNIRYLSDEGALTFSLRVPSVFQLDDVLNLLDSGEIKKKFTQIQKQGLSRNKSGEYIVKVNVIL